MLAITSRLEIDIHKNDRVDPIQVIDFAKKHQCAAAIVDPEMFDVFNIAKNKRNSIVKLGILLDYPKGESVGMNKFTNLPKDISDAYYFDVSFKKNGTIADYKKNIQFVKRTVSNNISNIIEVRPIVDIGLKDHAILEALATIAMPMVRLGSKIVLPASYDFTSDIKNIKNYTSTPIKICGNITADVIKQSIRLLGKNGRFGVSFEQAKELVKQLNNPTIAKSILDIPEHKLSIADLVKAVTQNTSTIKKLFPQLVSSEGKEDDEGLFVLIKTNDSDDVNIQSIELNINGHKTELPVKVQVV